MEGPGSACAGDGEGSRGIEATGRIAVLHPSIFTAGLNTVPNARPVPAQRDI